MPEQPLISGLAPRPDAAPTPPAQAERAPPEGTKICSTKSSPSSSKQEVKNAKLGYPPKIRKGPLRLT
jgi:hypothetical protein